MTFRVAYFLTATLQLATDKIILKNNPKTFVDRNENVVPLQMKSRKQVSSDNESVRCKSPDRDLVICDVAHAQQSESTTFIAFA